MPHAHGRSRTLLLPERGLRPLRTAGGPATFRSAATSARLSTGCCTATPARPASPSSRAPRCSTPSSRTTRPSPSWSTWPRAAASARRPGCSASARTPSRGSPAWPARTRRPPTTSWWRFPPETREVQFDEKWSFVAKKQAHCDPADPADDHKGDWWDHVAYDPEHRLTLCVVPGARDVENVEAVVNEAMQRTGGRVMDLMTSDDYPAYETAILNAYGREVTTTPTGRPS